MKFNNDKNHNESVVVDYYHSRGNLFLRDLCSSSGTTVKEEPVKEAVTAPATTEEGKATSSRTVVTFN